MESEFLKMKFIGWDTLIKFLVPTFILTAETKIKLTVAELGGGLPQYLLDFVFYCWGVISRLLTFYLNLIHFKRYFGFD